MTTFENKHILRYSTFNEQWGGYRRRSREENLLQRRCRMQKAAWGKALCRGRRHRRPDQWTGRYCHWLAPWSSAYWRQTPFLASGVLWRYLRGQQITVLTVVIVMDNWSFTQRTPCSCRVPWTLWEGTKGVIKGHGLSVKSVIEAVHEGLFGTLMFRVARMASLSARFESSEVEGTWI